MNDISIIPTRCKCCGQELELIGKYQEALSNLCGVDYSYMKGHKDVDAIVELITFVTLAFDMEETINRQQIEIERLEEEVKDYAKVTTWLTEERDKRDKEIENLKKELETVKYKTVKEVVKRLEEKNTSSNPYVFKMSNSIDLLVEEMGCNDG